MKLSFTTAFFSILLALSFYGHSQVLSGDPLIYISEAYDASLTGEYHFGFYLGTTNIGHTSLIVEKAGNGPDQAVYKIKTTARMVFGSEYKFLEKTSYLDARLSLISYDEYEEESLSDGSISTSVEQLYIEEGLWKISRIKDDEITEGKFQADGGNYPDIPCMLMLVKKIPPDATATYTLPWLDWPSTIDNQNPPVYSSLTIEADGVPRRYEFKGNEVDTYQVRFTQEEGEEYIFVVGPEQRVLSIFTDDIPVYYLAGTKEEVLDDLPELEIESSHMDGPKAVVQEYFEIIAKAKPVENLDSIIDWQSIHTEMAEQNSDVLNMTPGMLASLFKQQFKNTEAPVSVEQVNLLIQMIDIQIDGDSAKVTLPGSDDAFILRNTENGWLILHFPH